MWLPGRAEAEGEGVVLRDRAHRGDNCPWGRRAGLHPHFELKLGTNAQNQEPGWHLSLPPSSELRSPSSPGPQACDNTVGTIKRSQFLCPGFIGGSQLPGPLPLAHAVSGEGSSLPMEGADFSKVETAFLIAHLGTQGPETPLLAEVLGGQGPEPTPQ